MVPLPLLNLLSRYFGILPARFLRHLVVSRFGLSVRLGPRQILDNSQALACPTIELYLDRPRASPPLPKGTLCGRDNGATVASVAVDITNARLHLRGGTACSSLQLRGYVGMRTIRTSSEHLAVFLYPPVAGVIWGSTPAAKCSPSGISWAVLFSLISQTYSNKYAAAVLLRH